MSRGRGGMQSNVAHALGFTPPSRNAPESLTCACGGTIVFATDALGRLVEKCPRGRCFATRLVVPNKAAVDAVAIRIERNLLNASKPKKRRNWEPRICESTSCLKEFSPNSPTQRFCSNACTGKMVGGGRGKNLGLAANARSDDATRRGSNKRGESHSSGNWTDPLA